MTLFASAALARAIAEVEGVPTEQVMLSCGGHAVPALLAAGKPVTDRVWLDYLEPAATEGATVPVRYLPRLIVGQVDTELWHAEVAPMAARKGVHPAPYVDFSRFSSWEDAEAWFCRERSSYLKSLDRLARKTAREVGTLRFDPSDRDATAFEQLLVWKRAHYARTGVGDPLAVRKNIELFRTLFRDGTLELYSLRGGDRLLAAIAVVRLDGRLYYWTPSYDTELAALSVGNQLLLRSIRHSYETGDREYDFMAGGEPYKWQFATHTRLIGSVGITPVARRLRRAASGAKHRLQAVRSGSSNEAQ